jgi:AmmeMemoRadiSam system radical SAM enzyme/AmmeMemoRadiSam system protein B/AmmeMemoRadiSam system protein A
MSTPVLPIVDVTATGDALGRWWSTESDGRILCQLCPRACRLKDGDRGFCFVRKNVDGQMVLDTYGRSTGFCIDPIEKKPLNHFLPGTPVLSFGTAGCNLGCKFCQNWDISKSREVARLSDQATPEDIAVAAKNSGCRSVAFTYNDPVIWAEYAIDTAAACHAIDVKTVAVTAGYITPQARGEFFDSMDATNIDLKAFTEEFYYKLTGAHLDPILETIRYVANETDCWMELTNLIIPRANDDDDELQRMCDWVLDAVGDEVPVHFTAFHPDFRMTDRPRTSHETLIRAFDIACEAGLKYPYVGNIHDVDRQSTYCPSCRERLIERDWHRIGRYALKNNQCSFCGQRIAGHFESTPGDWGQKRQPIQIASHQATAIMPTTKSISQQDLSNVHRSACSAVQAIVNDQPFDADQSLGELADAPISGIYVTLKRGETLRGCCGLQGGETRLATALVDSATRTAKHDPRMAPISPIELPHLNVSVSILGPPRPIGASGDDRVSEVKIGRHGLRIQMENKAGLLLPVVAKERNWNSHQFLDAVCTKAGLPPGSWRSDDADVQIFDGIDYGAPMIMETESIAETHLISDDELEKMRSWVQSNIIAFQSGATPAYYADGVADCTVSGVVLNMAPDPNRPAVGWMQLSIREGVPLQSSILKLTEHAAQALRNHSWVDGWRADVAVLSSTVHHGTAFDHDLSEVDCHDRALLAMDGRRWSVGFDDQWTPAALLRKTLDCQPFRSQATQIYSARCDTTETSFSLSSGPIADDDVSIRPPAVAGTFYPSDDADREALIDNLLDGLPKVSPRRVAAAMVPHAGLRFSGRIAAEVWRRIELPETVLIISPKHTADGVDWAVAPHNSWQISTTASLVGDVELAKQIADAVPGMELDAGAHAHEHGIEVQLPLLHRISPNTKVTAIAMAGGTLEELQNAADALAKLIRSTDKPPLLIISSDMNHFADDEENRRRDRLALDKLKQIDPQGLLKTCASENISMCGQLPAALVLLTLRSMGIDAKYDEIAYDTSASTSGDRRRVVGYAGVLF